MTLGLRTRGALRAGLGGLVVALVALSACSGEDGKNGKNGADGQDGEPGEKGDPGERGAKGDPGEQGEQGILVKMARRVKMAPPDKTVCPGQAARPRLGRRGAIRPSFGLRQRTP